MKDSDLFDIPFYETYCGHQYMNLELLSIYMIMMCSKENEFGLVKELLVQKERIRIAWVLPIPLLPQADVGWACILAKREYSEVVQTW